MNRRYAYRDDEILVSAQPAGSQPGWRPEICVIAPDAHWQFVPTHHSLLANDPRWCFEIGRRCAESAIQSMDPEREMFACGGHWHRPARHRLAPSACPGDAPACADTAIVGVGVAPGDAPP